MRRLAVLMASAATAALLSGCGTDTASDSATPSDSEAAGGSCTYTETGDASRKVDLPPSEPSAPKSLKIVTNRGTITATLEVSKTPCTANSFASLAKQGYFDDTKCHRLTTEGIFVLQCGDPTGSGSGGPGYSFDDELSGKETYPAGTLAMANAGPNTNGSQFFLVYADTPLPASYAVFGKIDAAGLRVVKGIAKAGTANGASDGPPKADVVIKSVE